MLKNLEGQMVELELVNLIRKDTHFIPFMLSSRPLPDFVESKVVVFVKSEKDMTNCKSVFSFDKWLGKISRKVPSSNKITMKARIMKMARFKPSVGSLAWV